MKKLLKTYVKEISGFIIIGSLIGSFFQDGFYIYGVVSLIGIAVFLYDSKTITSTLHDKEEKEKQKLIDYLDRKEEIKEKRKNINDDY